MSEFRTSAGRIQRKPSVTNAQSAISRSRSGSRKESRKTSLRIMPNRSDKGADKEKPPLRVPTPSLKDAIPNMKISAAGINIPPGDFASLVHKYGTSIRLGFDRVLHKLSDSFGGGQDICKNDHHASLAQMAHEVSTELGDSLLGQMMALYSEAHNNVSAHQALYDMEVDLMVLRPLQNLWQPERVDSMEKLCKRYQKSSVEVQNLLNKLMKSESANRDDAERLRRDLDAVRARDSGLHSQYSTEVFEEVSGKDLTIAEKLMRQTEERIKYYEGSLTDLRQSLAKMKEVVKTSAIRPMFGCSLEQHCAVHSCEVSLIIQGCCAALLPHIQTEAGIFRLAGPATQVRRLKAGLDNGVLDFSDCSPHTVASVLKQYLRDLPDPLMTALKQPVWIALSEMDGEEQERRNQLLHQHVHELPTAHYNNLRYLVVFLKEMCQYQDVTKMGASNLAVVIGPNLIHNTDEVSTFQATSQMCAILEELIARSEVYFPEGAELVTILPQTAAGLASHLAEMHHKRSYQAVLDQVRRSLDSRRGSSHACSDSGDSRFYEERGSLALEADALVGVATPSALATAGFQFIRDRQSFSTDSSMGPELSDDSLAVNLAVHASVAYAHSTPDIAIADSSKSEKKTIRLAGATIRNALRRHKRISQLETLQSPSADRASSAEQ